VAGRVLRPLRVITAATRRISADNLHERLAVAGPADEVKALADTIDELLERLEQSFAAQRRFVADASHELRTPLATIRATLDVAVAKPGPVPAETVRVAGRVRTSLDEVEGLLEGLLLLARAQHGALDDRTAVSLTALTADALRAQETELDVYADLAAGVRTRGNPVLLARLVGNVIDNAVRHNVAGGWVRVAVAAGGGSARLTVESTGPVLDPAQVARLGQPFQRLGAARTGDGTGLGLSIVAAVAAAHGGTLDLVPRPDGGLLLTVALPA
jgi:signal transduction histidine kinase